MLRALAFWAAGCGAIVQAKGLEVHEWGTFTTLSTSWGENLEGLYVDATRLPGFVHGLPFFNYGAAGWPAPDRLRGVTVKMETPVLYFYSQAEVAVKVKVGFQGGTISQWYPERSAGEANPAGPTVDLGAQPYPGSITWQATVLAKGASQPYTQAAEQAAVYDRALAEWTAPRLTASNLIRGKDGEIEKFLFYRGLGNFPQALHLRFDAAGKLVVRNTGAEDIPFVLVYERREQGVGGNPYVWWQGGLAAGEQKALEQPAMPDFMAGVAAMDSLHRAMVAQGLHADEARALLNTWYNGYFIESGLKAFWILPRKQVDRLLPLEMTPAPEILKRVIIGRSEILPAEFEARLVAEGGTLPTYAKDKYHLAYLDFLSRWQGRQAVPVTHRLPAGVSRRPWSLALPWEGPFASPALRGRPQGSGRDLAVDARGRTVYIPAR